MHIDPATILIAEDDQALLEICAERLRREGYCVLTAENGSEAMDCLKTIHVDLLLTDLAMPVMDGITLLKNMKAKPCMPKVIVVTGFACAADVGVDGVLVKPYELQDLVNLVRHTLHGDELRTLALA